MRNIKRMAALLLAVVLVLSCLPAAAVFATELPEETVPVTTGATDPPTTETEPAVTVETLPPEDPPDPTEATVPEVPDPSAVPPESTSTAEEPTDPVFSTPTEPEVQELYRATTPDGSVTAEIVGTVEASDATDFQILPMEATDDMVDDLMMAIYAYTGSTYAPITIVPFQVGFLSGRIQGSFTLTLTLPGDRLSGSPFILQGQDSDCNVHPDVMVTEDAAVGTVRIAIPLTALDSGVFTVTGVEPVSTYGGSSGSTIGAGGSIGGGGTGGKGSNLGTAVGVTMQVVYYRYEDCWNRNNSYNCVIDTLLKGENAAHPAMDDDGTVLNNTVLDGFTWLPQNTFWSSGAGEANIYGYRGTNYPLNYGQDVYNFVKKIIFGNDYGAWDKSSVGNDSSTYTKVLRMLGTPEDKIQNYLDSFNDRLSVEEDGDTLIPTIIWAWYGQETQSSVGTREYLSGNILSYRSLYYQGEKWVATQTLTTPYSSPSSLLGTVDCHWAYVDWSNVNSNTDLVGCMLLYGDHGCTSHSVNIYDWQTTYGTGFVNRIQADGVDSSSRYYYFRGYWTPYGSVDPTLDQPLTLEKGINASPECIAQLTDNAMYSLEGAKYDVIIDENVVETITTGANGTVTTTKKFKPGTSGYVVEVEAPKGFRLDSTPVPFTIPISGECVVQVSDVPVMDPPFAITKVDKDTTTPQGDSSFSGAVFQFEYFDNESWSGDAKRTWYFQTDEDGWARYNPSFLAPDYTSDALYVNSSGQNEMPLGTAKITEIENSLGYIVLPQSLYVSIVEDPSSPYGAKFVWTPESWEILVDMASGNFGIYEPINQEIFGSLTIQKKDKDFGTTAPTWATLAGCEFTVYNRSANPVKIGENETAQPDEACLVLTVDETGLISTGNIFPVGTYEVKETKGNDYYQCNEEWSYTFTVTGTEDHPAFTTECADTMRPAALHLSKTDTDGNPLPGSKFRLEWSADGIDWQLVTKADDIVMGGCSSPELDENGCLTIGDDGTVDFIGLYPAVYYRITEVEAPNGYQLLKDPILVEKLLPENNFENSFRVINNDIFTLPKTGGNGFLATLIPAELLLALSCAAMLTVLFSKRKRR